MDEDASKENTYIFDPESPQEMARLINQDRFITRALDGTLAGLPPLPPNTQVLDLACGPGGWALEVAYEYPEIEVSGIDISRIMIDYAYARARSQSLNNVSFGIMDIRDPLDFADGSFDMINARFLYVVLKREAWKTLMAECRRLLRPGGILQLCEVDDFGMTSSAAYEQLGALNMQALHRAGYGFSPTGHTLGMSQGLLQLYKEAGMEDVHLRSSIADYSAGTEAWADFYHNGNVA